MAIIREEISNSKLYQLLPPVAINANKEDIAAVDVTGFESVTFAALVGAATVEPDNDKYLHLKLEHSDDNVNFVDCSAEEITGAMAGPDSGIFAALKSAPEGTTSFMASYIGPKRYVRPVVKVTGDLGDGVMLGIAAILQGPKYRPVN